MSEKQQITFINTNLTFSLNNTEEENHNKFSIDFQYKIKQVAIGRGYILILTDNGKVYFKGKLSDLDYTDNYFTKLETISPIIKFIASGENFILLIDQFNKIFIYGVFGTDNYKKFTEIGQIEKKDEIKFISCGGNIVIIVTQKNELIIGGDLQAFNGKDNGFGYTNTIDYFIKVDNSPVKSEIKDLQCGYYHTIVLDYNGNIYGSGENTRGQLGLGKSNKGTILSSLTQLNIPFKVKKISTTPEGTLLLNYHNELYGSGENYAFQLGVSSKQNVLQFKKIVINNVCVDSDNNITKPLIIKKLFNTFKHLTVILTENDGFYLTGQHVKKGFRKLKDINDCKDWKYNYAFLSVENNNDVVFLFQTSYKINEKEQKRKDLFEKLKASAKSYSLLSDIVFHFSC